MNVMERWRFAIYFVYGHFCPLEQMIWSLTTRESTKVIRLWENRSIHIMPSTLQQEPLHPGDTHLLLGLYTTILETGNRIELPNEIEEQFDDGLFITQGFDRNIMVLTTDAFEEVYERVTSVNIADPLVRLLMRMILASAYRAEVGPDGTIQLSEKLKTFAQLKKDVVLVGQGDFMEIWSSDVWDQQKQQLLELEIDPGRFASLLVTTR